MGVHINGTYPTRTRTRPALTVALPQRFPVLAGAGSPSTLTVSGADGYIDLELRNGDRFVIAVEHLPRLAAALIAAGLDANASSCSAS